MRNLFLTLMLANLVVLAWQFWVSPAPPVGSPPVAADLVLFGNAAGSPTARPIAAPADGPTDGPADESGNCLRIGPLPAGAAAQQDIQQLAARGIDAVSIARDAQLWLGHWVQVAGFSSVPAAEAARQRLVAAGLADAYLMQDGAEPMISMGVFRDRPRADRIAGDARRLGFEVTIRDRYRPAVEQWLLIRPRPGQVPKVADLRLAGDRIMRTERTPCDPPDGVPPPGNRPAAPAGPP